MALVRELKVFFTLNLIMKKKLSLTLLKYGNICCSLLCQIILLLPFLHSCIKSISLCCIPRQNILYCKSAFSKDCAGGDPDSFSFTGRVIEETEEEGRVCVPKCVRERGRKCLRENERQV